MSDMVLDTVIRRVRRIDPVFLVTIALAGLLAVIVPQQALNSAGFVGGAMLSILPFIAASVAIAGFAKASGLDRQIAAVFSGAPLRAIFVAALFGVASPFCSCGVIPVIAALLAAGVPLGPVMAFWIASPLMSPEKFMVMLGAFPLDFSIASALAALAMGLGAGLAIHVFAANGRFDPILRPGMGPSSCSANRLDNAPPVLLPFWREAERKQAFGDTVIESGLFLLKWLLLAFLIESLMIAYLPAEQIGQWLGNDSWWAIPASILVGIPAYLNGYAAVPLISGLMEMGMSPGAAVGFMLAGGVTSFPAAMAVFALVRRPVFVSYILLGLVGSFAMAYTVQAVFA